MGESAQHFTSDDQALRMHENRYPGDRAINGLDDFVAFPGRRRRGGGGDSGETLVAPGTGDAIDALGGHRI